MPVDYFDQAVAITRRTYADPVLHPYALAQMDRLTIGRFALDHEQHTARLLKTGCGEVRGCAGWQGLPAEIHGLPEGRIVPTALPGLELEVMDWPLRGQRYRIVGEVPR